MAGRPDSFMPLFIGAYLADTMDLTTLEHGAYLLLIMRYWRSGPLPDDDVTLCQITRMSASEWRRSGPIIRKFFSPAMIDAECVLVHKRIEKELAEANERYNDKKAASDAGVAAKRAKRDAKLASLVEPSVKPSVERVVGPKQQIWPYQNGHSDRTQTHKYNNTTGSDEPVDKSSLRSDSCDFARFYEIFPLHKARRAAEKAWPSAVKRAGSSAIIIAGAERYRDDPGRNPEKTKHPATWLNADCWLDEAANAKPNAVDELVEQWRKEAENGQQS